MYRDKILPKEIKQLCLAFYFSIDYFSKCGKSIILLTKDKHNDLISANRATSWNTAYGDLPIVIKNTPNHIYSWTISTTDRNISIGLDSSEFSALNTDFIISTGIYHCWATNQGLITNQGDCSNVDIATKYTSEISSYSQLITMELNCKQRTIKFIRNGMDYGIAFKNLDDRLTYRFVISIQSDSCVQLLNFEEYSAP